MTDAPGSGAASVASQLMAFFREPARFRPHYIHGDERLPDGLYRVRLTVSDSPSNPVDRARTAVFLAPPQRVDNTAPRVSASARIADGRLIVEGRAEDPLGGRIAEVRVSIDGGPWQALAPKDGLLDGPDEAFASALPLPAAGEHDLVVQALDADSNPGAAGVSVAIPVAR